MYATVKRRHDIAEPSPPLTSARKRFITCKHAREATEMLRFVLRILFFFEHFPFSESGVVPGRERGEEERQW